MAFKLIYTRWVKVLGAGWNTNPKSQSKLSCLSHARGEEKKKLEGHDTSRRQEGKRRVQDVSQMRKTVEAAGKRRTKE